MSQFIALDVETANSFMGSICQIGLAAFNNGQLFSKLSILIDPHDYFEEYHSALHGITAETVRNQPRFVDLIDDIDKLVSDLPVIHHTHFDRVAIRQACAASGVALREWRWLDSAKVARRVWPDVAERGYGLAPLAERLGISFKHHDAAEDAFAAGAVMCRALQDSQTTLEEWFQRVERKISTQDCRRIGMGEGPLAGECVVFTGAMQIPRKTAADRAQALGADVAKTLTRETTILVVGDQDLRRLAGHEKSSKQRKAETLIAQGYPMRIVAEADFLAF